jgi:serine-type anaerobic sulfatase-maturating enzyme
MNLRRLGHQAVVATTLAPMEGGTVMGDTQTAPVETPSAAALPVAPASFHLLAKPTGAVCNLDCAYCFFLSKEMLYPGSAFRMADDLLETYIRQLIEAHARSPVVTIAWQGGEPTLMGLEFFSRSVELAEQHLRPGQRAEHTIQTNGTLLDEEWAAFFREHDFLVGISIDGPRDLHDAYRVNKGGKGSFDQVMRGLEHLREAGVAWNALTTIHAANADHGRDVYRFLRDECGARFVQLIPIIERVPEAAADGTVPWTSWRDRPLYVQEGNRVSGRSVTAEQYGRFLIDVFEEWVRRDVGTVYVQMFDVALANWVGEPPSLCIHSETCGLALALEHTGDLYSCDHFVEPGYRLGNIRETPMLELVASQKQRQFGLDKRDTLPRFCRECDVRFACHGGCPKDRFISTPDGEPGLNYLCAGYKDFFHHLDRPMRFMADQLRRNAAPAEIMNLYAAEDAHRGRNDRCTCGSGRKWKHCHGESAPPAAR